MVAPAFTLTGGMQHNDLVRGGMNLRQFQQDEVKYHVNAEGAIVREERSAALGGMRRYVPFVQPPGRFLRLRGSTNLQIAFNAATENIVPTPFRPGQELGADQRFVAPTTQPGPGGGEVHRA